MGKTSHRTQVVFFRNFPSKKLMVGENRKEPSSHTSELTVD